MSARPRSKTRATWLTLLGGTFGLHRFWRHGLRDAWGWLHLLATLTGLAGLQRLDAFGIDDAQAAWMLPLGGLSFAAAMLATILTGLTPNVQRVFKLTRMDTVLTVRPGPGDTAAEEEQPKA